jgi:dolichol-phosphate mannosyltransferase
MDCDLQDRPEEIHRLYEKAREGYDVVFSRRTARKDGFLKKLSSKVFHGLYGYFTGGAFDSTISNFSICRRMVADNYKRMGDRNRAFILFIKWMGFKSAVIDVVHAERCSGSSSYTLKKQLQLACEIITTQSNKPLVMSIKVGCVVTVASFLYGMVTLYRYFFHSISATGWTSLIVSICFVGGIIIAEVGVLGLYIGYVFDQTKGRPLYIVRETVECQTSRLGE